MWRDGKMSEDKDATIARLREGEARLSLLLNDRTSGDAATIARLSEQVNTLTTEKHADAEAIGALEAKLAEVTEDLEWMKANRNRWQDAATRRYHEGFAQGIQAAADTDMIEQAMLDRQSDGADPREVAQYISDCIRALSPTPQADGILDDSSLRSQVGELGNQIHNLGCEYQGDERLAERLGELRSIAWGLARVASAAPQAKAVDGLTDHEQKSQAARCPCGGSDDWCPCQNVADRETRDARASTPQADPVREAAEMPRAWLDVMGERARQIAVEGWSTDHDDLYGNRELAQAAESYIHHHVWMSDQQRRNTLKYPPLYWPFSRGWWKPTSRRRDLVKAGALILAEIERLDRALAQKGE